MEALIVHQETYIRRRTFRSNLDMGEESLVGINDFQSKGWESLPLSKTKIPIHYMRVIISYKKNNQTHKKETWIVTKYPLHDVLAYDTKTKSKLEKEFYSSTYKGVRSMIILDVVESKVIGHGMNDLYE